VVVDLQSAAGRSSQPRLVRVGHFDFPIYIAGTKADPHAIYVLERAGRIWIIRNGHRQPHPFLDISKNIRLAPKSEQGLLSMAFAPDYRKSGLYYVYYTNVQGHIRLGQFRRSPTNPNRTIRHSERMILRVTHPGAVNHYGGQLQFGHDGYLYIGIGDGGGIGDPPNHAQTLDNLYGKILRIKPNVRGRRPYRIPRTNPFVHTHGARPEILAYGLRNPWRFSFDSHGAIWIADVGEDKFEEIDYRKRGQLAGINFGWSRYEGYSQYSNRSAPGAIFPILVEAHSGGHSGTHETWCAIIGGYVVRDHALPSLFGSYLFGDHCLGNIYSTRVNSQGSAFGTGPTGLQVPGFVSSMGEDSQHHIYIASIDGSVYRIAGG
jgi:glucose/arabinose dehydrogenase